jgi:hypothetical protein
VGDAGGSLADDECCPEGLAGWSVIARARKARIMGLASEVLVLPGWLA